MEKVVVRELKAAHKTSQKRKKRQGNRAPSGFVKPTTISSELANFLNRPKGEQMARTEVTREINAYIRKNSLQDPNNGRKINPDSALAQLLKLTPQHSRPRPWEIKLHKTTRHGTFFFLYSLWRRPACPP